MKIINLGERFRIVFYQLDKIIENWGKCQGLSGRDMTELSIMEVQMKAMYKKSLPFGNFSTSKARPSRGKK